jgi:hypothetical protein
MARQLSAPQCDTSCKADAMQVYTDVSALSADPDLTALSKKPKFGPQKTTLTNAEAAAASIVLVDEDSITHTISVPPGGVMVLTRPFISIDESASGNIDVVFEWFDPAGSNDWNP